MALEGAVENAYSRVYRFVKPNSSEPGTWRLATPENQIGGGGGQPGGALLQDIDGVDPIQAVTIPGNPTRTTISLDITALTSRV